ncbi:DUF192 domain-containing protein [Kordiimonas laminariae]|uniref:DUF192 domain-containing protein n=1 Tax=Kordiimonas laminariae TaxID=2917717 RepID=UPI001FF482EE|nr:DUF192 domain-containing protein [Kordiimonas laminariae]MCK0070983.1 DUF192 domain-containing protein [Kordiimonas laminariae]
MKLTQIARRLMACVLLFLAGSVAPANAQEKLTTPLIIERADGSVHEFHVELALSNAQRQQGLMNREHLEPDAGMLFIFPNEDYRSFWMRNTLIPLDIIFMKKTGEILNIRANAKPLDEGPRYSSEGKAKAVLEIPGGRAEELNIKPGDVVRHAFLGNAKTSKN